MAAKIWQVLYADGLEDSLDEVNKENRMAVRYLAIAGLPLGFVSAVAQSVFLPGPDLFNISLRSCWMFIYFVILFLLDRFVIPDEVRHGALLIYIIEAPVMIASILLGSFWDPEHQAMTFFIFLMAMPVLVLDRPVRLLSVFVGWTAIFIAACAAVKTPEILQRDILHAVEFFLASGAVTSVVVRLRQVSLQQRQQSLYLLEHDELTGARNRRCLERSEKGYLGKPLMILLAELDQLHFLNDFFGHAFGNKVIVEFSHLMSESFGEERSYRIGGDAMLCIAQDMTEREFLALLDDCRAKLQKREIEGQTVDLNCAFGYTMGTPSTAEEFRQMVQLANIHAHNASSSGKGQTAGSSFDEGKLHEGISESVRSTHARAYETNQLTGLPSISYFFARSEELLTTVIDTSLRPVIGFIKLSHMKEYNENFGYARGDALIKHVAEVLLASFSQRSVCSISGGQFGVLCYLDEVAPYMRLVDAALKEYDCDHRVSCKAGFAEYAPGDNPIALLDKARIAYKSLADQGDVLYRIYDEKLDEEIRFKQYIVSHLDEAIDNDYLQVFYQPIVRSVTGEICNEEALSRWDDPVYGFLPPFKFIPPLEESRQVYKLSLNVVRQVLRDFRKKRELGVPIVPVSVNLSRYDFEQCDIVQEITDIVDASEFARDMIMIEITESAFVKNQEFLKREVNRFRANGFQVWMDDFGSEYSTLNLLQELEFDLIKIDMQFMKNFSESNKNLIIVSDILDMAKRMGIVTLIEGIETEEHYRTLRDMGCNKLQGFLFDRPNSLDYVIDRALNHKRLAFEKPEEAPYYNAISLIDLNAPFASSGLYDKFKLSGQLPVSIIEQTRDGYSCMLGNDRFFQLVQQHGSISEEEARNIGVVPPERLPEGLRSAIAECAGVEGWVNVELAEGGQRSSSVYLRAVSKNESNGNMALLFVVLSADKAV